MLTFAARCQWAAWLGADFMGILKSSLWAFCQAASGPLAGTQGAASAKRSGLRACRGRRRGARVAWRGRRWLCASAALCGVVAVDDAPACQLAAWPGSACAASRRPWLEQREGRGSSQPAAEQPAPVSLSRPSHTRGQGGIQPRCLLCEPHHAFVRDKACFGQGPWLSFRVEPATSAASIS